MKKRIGIYAWGGPGTIRLLQTKYHTPKINEQSFLQLYDLPYLMRAKELFGVTDAWVTYSWGFSDEHEQEAYTFVTSRLKNFEKLGIATHAYIQGFNLVTADFADQDLFCKTPSGQPQPYSKGRSFTCPNNPVAVKIILDRVEKACQENFTGIYIDNIVFGLPPVFVSKNFVPFWGCACEHCQTRFQDEVGYELPVNGFSQKTLKAYLQFRTRTIERFVKASQAITQKHHKQFGVNLYDPFLHTPELYFGYSLKKISPYLSYFLIENNFHPSRLGGGNQHLREFAKVVEKSNKPLFVVSYKKGIGFDEQFTQPDIDELWSESNRLGFSPCLKVTEYLTKNVWHALKLDWLKQPESHSPTQPLKNSPKLQLLPQEATLLQIQFAKLLQKNFPFILSTLYEHRLLDKFVRKSGFFQKQLWTAKLYELE